MDVGTPRYRTIAAAVALLVPLAILSLKALSWGSVICAALFALGAYPTLANAMAYFRGDEPSVTVYKGEDGTKALGRVGSILGPASFTALVTLIWMAS
ncbi:MAG: hypothetical protein QOF05_847 [Sphingomonadales bacterium]|nr:hypothetical protein [Sphingomonadales bacterium]